MSYVPFEWRFHNTTSTDLTQGKAYSQQINVKTECGPSIPSSSVDDSLIADSSEKSTTHEIDTTHGTDSGCASPENCPDGSQEQGLVDQGSAKTQETSGTSQTKEGSSW